MTLYHVLVQQDDGSFVKLRDIEANSGEQANRRAADQDGPGTYVSVPARSWTLTAFEREQVTRLKKVGVTGSTESAPLPGQTSLTDIEQAKIERIAAAVE